MTRSVQRKGNDIRLAALCCLTIASLVLVASLASARELPDPIVFYADLTAGDFIREVAHLMHNWDVTETSGFVTTSALPIGAAPIDPSQATDRPQ